MVKKTVSFSNATNKSSSSRATAAPPAPFTLAPTELTPFFEYLDPRKVYIVHIDKFPTDFKKRIFAVPVALNLVIAILLVWRIYYIAPTYYGLIQLILGHESDWYVDRSSRTTKELLWIVFRRTLTFFIDFILFRFILPWPITFFFEKPANPVLWRLYNGFQKEEVVVRESRNWGVEDLLHGVRTGGDSPFFKTRIAPAVDRTYIRTKTGYMMMDKSWDLDFYAMVQAHRLLRGKKVDDIKTFDKTVLVHSSGGDAAATKGTTEGQWLAWQVWKMDEPLEEEEQRKKIVDLKDRLTAMGKENLFFRWIEIVQYESGKPGPFTPERQQAMLDIVKSEFDKQGVNFEELIKEIGGFEGTPGMETLKE